MITPPPPLFQTQFLESGWNSLTDSTCLSPLNKCSATEQTTSKGCDGETYILINLGNLSGPMACKCSTGYTGGGVFSVSAQDVRNWTKGRQVRQCVVENSTLEVSSTVCEERHSNARLVMKGEPHLSFSLKATVLCLG